MTNPETVADVLAEMRSQNLLSTHDWADRIERAMAASAINSRLYHAVNLMMAVVCSEGEILNRTKETEEVMAALAEIDGGTYAPAVPVESLGRDVAPYSAPFTTDVRNCCESPETCPEPCAPPNWSVPDVLTADDVQWIVNDNAELGVMIRGQAFFLYKGDSLVYDDAKHDDGTPMYYRTVGKREFGECAYPINHSDYSKQGTVSLGDSDRWQLLPPTTPEESP